MILIKDLFFDLQNSQAMHDVPQIAKTVHGGTPVMNGFAMLVEAPPQSPQDTLYPGNDSFTICCSIFQIAFGEKVNR